MDSLPSEGLRYMLTNNASIIYSSIRFVLNHTPLTYLITLPATKRPPPSPALLLCLC
jgi:hypothetical protein